MTEIELLKEQLKIIEELLAKKELLMELLNQKIKMLEKKLVNQRETIRGMLIN
jgi:hypothetical protein